jgi:hypothetical protein
LVHEFLFHNGPLFLCIIFDSAGPVPHQACPALLKVRGCRRDLRGLDDDWAGLDGRVRVQQERGGGGYGFHGLTSRPDGLQRYRSNAARDIRYRYRPEGSEIA